MEGLDLFWLNSIAIILAVSFITKYKERKERVAQRIRKDVPAVEKSEISSLNLSGDQSQKGVNDVEKAEVSFLNLTEKKSQIEVSAIEIAETGSLNLTEYQSQTIVGAVENAGVSFLNLSEEKSQNEVIAVEKIEISSLNLTKEQSEKEVGTVEKAEISSINLTKEQSEKEVGTVEKIEINSLKLTEDQSQNITTTCDTITILSLREMLTNSNKEVWAFIEMKNEIYSAQISMEEGNVLLKSLSKRAPPENTEIIQYKTVKNLINRNNITTFLEINHGQRDNADGSSIFLHIQLKGDEGRIKQFELMCTGEEYGISYASTRFLEIESTPFETIWGGDRNDGHCGAIGEFTTGGEIIKTVAPGLVAGSLQRKPTHFVIYTKENKDYKENYTIGKVVYGLNNMHALYTQANLHGPKSINIVDCGIVLAGAELMNIPSPITIGYLKDMVTQTTPGIWAVLKIQNEDYSAQIVNIKGHLLLKSLSKRAPIPNASTIPHQDVMNLVNRDNTTIFLEIELSEKEHSNSHNKFIHIKLFGDQGRHKQYEAMCTGEVNGISYAKTDFLGILGFPAQGILGGARNDGLDTELPGFTRGESGRSYITPGLVAGFYDSIPGRKPTHFLIYTEEASHDYQETSSIGKVVLGLNDILMLYPYAKMNGSACIKIDDCGIVLD